MPQLARESDVLIMPYADLPVSRAMQPLKLKEYLATGKPAVVRHLPSTHEWGDCLDLAQSPEEFSASVSSTRQARSDPCHSLARSRHSDTGSNPPPRTRKDLAS